MIEVNRAVQAAIGYLHLGMAEEAWEELESLPANKRLAWPVVEARIGIFQVLDKWKEARELAETMARHFPEEPSWWIRWAFSLRREASAAEASHVLREAVQVHPRVALINYNLACYTCVMGDIKETAKWLQQAFAIDPDLRKVALDDKDLAPIWEVPSNLDSTL